MKDRFKIKKENFARRQKRVRAKITGTAQKPRVSVFRSLAHISVQAINDINGHTIVSASDKEIKAKKNKTETAFLVGELMGKKLNDNKIKEIVFDKGAYKYHGRVKALAEGIRKAGINF